MIKFSVIVFFSLLTGGVYSQTRMTTTSSQVQDNRMVSSSSSSQAGSASSSSAQISTRMMESESRGDNSNYQTGINNSNYHTGINNSNVSYSREFQPSRSVQAAYVNHDHSAVAFQTKERIPLMSRALDLPRLETAMLVFETQPLVVNGRTLDNDFRKLGFDSKTSVPSVQANPPSYGGGNSMSGNEQAFMNPFFKSNQQLQNCDYNKSQFNYTCSLTGLNTGYLSNHRCNGCVGYYHYWRTYTNFGCFEYLNGQINKVQSVEELKELIQSYYDCIDYYQQYNFLDANTRARYRYGVGH